MWFEGFLVIVISFSYFLLAFLRVCTMLSRSVLSISFQFNFVSVFWQSVVASLRDDVRELILVVVWVVTPVFCSFFFVVADGSIFFPACFVDVF
jgi:hypothetical protein